MVERRPQPVRQTADGHGHDPATSAAHAHAPSPAPAGDVDIDGATAAAAPEGDGSPIALLPRDLLPHIFTHLCFTDRCRLRRVCRAWNAAAMEPPHSTILAVSLLRRRGLWDATGKAVADSPAEREEAAFLASLRAALASPLGKGLRSVGFVLWSAEEDPTLPPRGPLRNWPLGEALRALPEGVADVWLSAPQDYAPDVEGVREALLALPEALPGLAELRLELGERVAGLLASHGLLECLVHERLQRLDARVGVPPRLVVAQLPALARLERLALDSRAAVADLERLAARGLRVRSLDAVGFNLSSPEAVAALAAVFRPADFDWPRPGRSELSLISTPTPPDGLPAGFGAGVQEITVNEIPRTLLPWLTEITKSPTLQHIIIINSAFRVPGPAHAVDLLQALKGCRGGLRVDMWWPGAVFQSPLEQKWYVNGLVSACELVAAEPGRLTGADVAFGLFQFLMALARSRTPSHICTHATLLAVELLAARCEAAAGRWRLRAWEEQQLSEVGRHLEMLCQFMADGEAGDPSLRDNVQRALDRFRSLHLVKLQAQARRQR